MEEVTSKDPVTEYEYSECEDSMNWPESVAKIFKYLCVAAILIAFFYFTTLR